MLIWATWRQNAHVSAGQTYSASCPGAARYWLSEFGTLLQVWQNLCRKTDLTGRIAAYAQGPDYHLVLPEKMEALVLAIQTRLGQSFPYLCYTDTGPVLERDLAQRAGLGWIGKNTCLIHPQHGSYFLLAEILLGIELELDAPFEADRCGSCTRCMEACPTGCIQPDRTLDANRCISYLSIEMKSSIPENCAR